MSASVVSKCSEVIVVAEVKSSGTNRVREGV